MKFLSVFIEVNLTPLSRTVYVMLFDILYKVVLTVADSVDENP